ncbi:hypothetical protein [Noviherbaspirillum autotrophicum]|uniref:hypothetical protein n=1 Tax=Noviherbaspirillum autotrophicum TaxID=709839 RepID=UPI0018E03DB6|nr:hypothetical protein [Noviherbaspirillum autotrophicum]
MMLLMLLGVPGVAQERHGRLEHEEHDVERAERGRAAPGRSHTPRHWSGDIRRFHEHDLALWRGGRWLHGRHGDQSGWWWIVGATWYFYPAPIYPYPNPYQPPPMASIAPPSDPSAMPQYWYYCADPPGYYPYVPQCRVNWRAVPATPP